MASEVGQDDGSAVRGETRVRGTRMKVKLSPGKRTGLKAAVLNEENTHGGTMLTSSS